MAYIAVDLDGTLAFYDGNSSIEEIGQPISLMVNRVKGWLKQGIEVKIFTARMCVHDTLLLDGTKVDMKTPIENWCKKHIGRILDVTNIKDFSMIELYDDRARQVEMNTGRIVGE